MKITIEELPIEMKANVIRIGGAVSYYHELSECFIATFEHHEIVTQGDYVRIGDQLTGYTMSLNRRDFFSIELI